MVLPAPYEFVAMERVVLAAIPAAMRRVRRAVRQAGTLHTWAAAHSEAEVLHGRAPLYVIPGENARWAVRHFRRGGAVERWLGDRYLRLGVPRPFRELRASAALRGLGVPTPRVIAAAVYPHGVFYRADLVTEYVPESRDLATSLFGPNPVGPGERPDAWAAAGRLLRTLHSNGVVHDDLNLKNILVDWSTSPPRALILDLDRCRVAERVPGWRRALMMRRFRRSLAKFEAASGPSVRHREWRAVHDAYQAAGA